MSILTLPPGLIKSAAIDLRTGQWTRPWLEYWEAQYIRTGQTNAPTNDELGSMIAGAEATSLLPNESQALLSLLQQRLADLEQYLMAQNDYSALLATVSRNGGANSGDGSVDRIVEVGETRTIANTHSVVCARYFQVNGTLELQGDAILEIL